MFDTMSISGTERSPADLPCARVLAFVEEHSNALRQAAELLAGRKGAKLAVRIAEDLFDAKCVSRRCRRDLEDLLDILALENVDDSDREEAARFAAIDPASPVVEEICLLTDGLRDALALTDTEHRPASRTQVAA